MTHFKKILLFILFAASFLIGAFASYIFLSLSKVFVKDPQNPKSSAEANPTLASRDSFNVLLLGYGGLGHDGGNLSDVVIIANIRPQEKKISIVSIPRDLWVKIPIRSDKSENFKINAAYAIGSDDKKYPLKEPQYKGEGGGGVMAKKVVGEVIGMPIDYFISVDFEGFKRIIDALDGIEVDVPVAFDDYFYPIKGFENETCGKSSLEISELHSKYSEFDLEKQFECRYEHIHFDKGKNRLDGDTTLKFVRSRHSDQHGGDFARSTRQQAVLLGLKDKLFSIYSVSKLDQLFNQFVAMVRTDLELSKAKQLPEILGKPDNYNKIAFISLTEDNVLNSTKSMDGQFILIPKEGEDVWVGVQKFISDKINEN